jgi:hypothetical protein
MSVGVMKDYKLRDLHASHRLIFSRKKKRKLEGKECHARNWTVAARFFNQIKKSKMKQKIMFSSTSTVLAVL